MPRVKEQPHFQGRTNAERTVDSVRRKAKFLDAYEEFGTIRKACEIAKIVRGTYTNWHVIDPDFAREMDTRKQAFSEVLEEIALDRVRNPDKGKGSDILLLGLLNANNPQKYRPQVAINEESAKELIIEWRKAANDVKKDAGGKPQELPNVVEDTLMEILERRGNAPDKAEEQEGMEAKE